MRVALYARVSSQEQAMYGLSIDAQLADLREYAVNNGHIIVGEYVDAGISGKKQPSKRPALSRFFSDLENGLGVDALIFTKLDRFFRSVKLYYQAVDVLDKHHVAWQAIQEDYETLTANGRLRVNLLLSINENEADRVGDRVRAVFKHKIERGECIAPASLPVGYTVQDKKVVHSEQAEAARAMFEYYAATQSVSKTMDYLRSKYGVSMYYASVRKALRNTMYIGEFRGNSQYCEPIIDKETFAHVQTMLGTHGVRKNRDGVVYIFSGILKCGVCGLNYTGARGSDNKKNYRCNRYAQEHLCTNGNYIAEKTIERHLLEHLLPQLDEMLASAKPQYAPKKRKQPDTKKMQAKLDRLKDLYVDGLISKEQYLADRNKVLESIQTTKTETPQTDYAGLREMIGKDFTTRYHALTDTQKQILWRSIIEKITIDENRTIRFFFR